MPTNTYVALDTVTLNSAATTVDFNSIVGTYTDLVVVCNATVSSARSLSLRFNSDAGSNYSNLQIYGTGSSALSAAASNTSYMFLAGVYTTLSTAIINIQNYSNTTTNKSVIVRQSTAGNEVSANVGLWRSNSAITSISISAEGVTNNLAAGSTFSLYGILAEGVSPAPKASGGIVYSDLTHYYHVFGSTGVFTPSQSMTADVLVVAGGGGGGYNRAGGGGAGGLRSFTSQSLTTTAYTCTVGAGGALGSSGRGTSGGNSSFAGSGFSTINATGGGGGGSETGGNQTGLSGGSGGGGASSFPTSSGGAGNSGGYSPVEGFAGGLGKNDNIAAGSGGGGGGAGGIGADGNATSPNYSGGNGGVGATSSFINAIGAATGTGQFSTGNYYFAGGGGGGAGNFITPVPVGGTGGLGGGGNGGSYNISGLSAGLPNTGGGGGGGTLTTAGSNAGSGVIIIRYTKA